jgi:hypothetical protein
MGFDVFHAKDGYATQTRFAHDGSNSKRTEYCKFKNKIIKSFLKNCGLKYQIKEQTLISYGHQFHLETIFYFLVLSLK